MEQKLLTNWKVIGIGALVSSLAALILSYTLTVWRGTPSISSMYMLIVAIHDTILLIMICLPLGIGGAFAGKLFVNKVWGVWTGAILISFLGIFAIATSGIICC